MRGYTLSVPQFDAALMMHISGYDMHLIVHFYSDSTCSSRRTYLLEEYKRGVDYLTVGGLNYRTGRYVAISRLRSTSNGCFLAISASSFRHIERKSSDVLNTIELLQMNSGAKVQKLEAFDFADEMMIVSAILIGSTDHEYQTGGHQPLDREEKML